MCSPRIRLSEKTIKETRCFSSILLEDVLKNLKMERLPVFSKRSDVDKTFIKLKETEFQNVFVARFRGYQTYLLDIDRPKYRILEIGPNCRDLALLGDKALLEKGESPINILKKICEEKEAS